VDYRYDHDRASRGCNSSGRCRTNGSVGRHRLERDLYAEQLAPAERRLLFQLGDRRRCPARPTIREDAGRAAAIPWRSSGTRSRPIGTINVDGALIQFNEVYNVPTMAATARSITAPITARYTETPIRALLPSQSRTAAISAA
jgi:hypothetical protein